MNESQANRRHFIKETIATAAGLVALPSLSNEVTGAPAIVRAASLGSDSYRRGPHAFGFRSLA